MLKNYAMTDDEDKFHQEVELSSPLCYSCAHWQRGTSMCKAYPKGIPVGILSQELDHREELPGDQGIIYLRKVF